MHMHPLSLPGTVWLDTALPDDENRRSLLFVRPVRVLQADTPEQVLPLLRALDGAVAAGYYVAGYISYEAGYALAPVPLQVPDEAGPLAWFGVYEMPHVLPPASTAVVAGEVGSYALQDLHLALSREAYRERVQHIRRLIREGEVYQINFTMPLRFRLEGDPLAFYLALRRQQPVAYAAFINTGERLVLSLSPELFFRREGLRIYTRPMKGTARRSALPEEDARLAEALRTDEKNRAENLMIVDLLRNDLSVCCEPGSVVVSDLFRVEAYPTVWQMTSTVEGQLRPTVSYADLFRALFPSGSVTGAPKPRAMQHITRLEPAPRGVYCGAIGYAAPGGEAVFNVAIRTLELTGEEGRMGVGSGIVWDSDPEAEYEECWLKGQFLRAAAEPFALIETMRCEQGRIPLLEMHLERLRRSAAHFGFALDEAQLRAQLAQVQQALPSEKIWRLRLTLDVTGRITLTSAELEPAPDRPWRLCIAHERLDPSDPLRYHKTTRRAHYEAAYLQARAAGYDEVLFLNTRGEVCEGSRTNLFVQIGGRLYTPPVSCGLLPGVYRQYVLRTRKDVAERVLTLADLRRAEALYVCNAVRGWQAATLEVPEPVLSLM
ncbi:aminodeoxychorismate synthase component I [Rhodothermus profundi]|uniref:Para-aminobenzoate synthetase / 4-amino-4-deoxychorismate lyase n=1 Tax=Rhodothermus profundi TaxID=633813 RepID=A0A1M6TGD1_9BACT|nr:aminodeoxychorismate synthase component I [Rhodothermus profundi]SHK55838.1 para-aminobenzoate synthetase / 4-amino-4-deoxychorismate lyase [Rhodothermus profundi]